MALSLKNAFSFRIGTKLSIMSGIGIALVLGMIAVQHWGSNAITKASENSARQSDLAQKALNAKASELGMISTVRDLRLARNSESLDRFKQNLSRHHQAAMRYTDEALKLSTSKENIDRLTEAKKLLDEYHAGGLEIAETRSAALVIRAGAAGADAEATKRIAALDEQVVQIAQQRAPVAAKLEEILNATSDYASKRSQEAVEEVRYDILVSGRISLGMGLLAVLVLVGSAFFGAFAIARPLARVVPELKKLADGDFNITLTGMNRADEVGMISQAVHTVAERVGSTITTIKVSAVEVTNASGEISTATTDLSQRTEEQAASLEETSASMEEMTATVKKNAENAKEANELAVNTREVADRGGAVVAQTVEAMAKIEESSRKISDIISVIDEIARQTNLLALNAAVEAARAGDAGRGFAVVASEVRSLAQRSSQAAKDIKELITSSTGQVKEGVDLVNRAGSALNEIVDSIKKVASVVSEIANASVEQSAGIEQIGKALAQMDEVTQQNSALVEENAATAKTLEQQARAMDERVAFFRLREGSDSAPPQPRDTSAPVQKIDAAERPAARPAPVAVRQPVPARAAGGGARRMQSALATALKEDDWKEF